MDGCGIESVSAGQATAEKEASSPASSGFILTSSSTSAFCAGSIRGDFAARVSSSDSSLSIRRACFLTLRIFKAARPLGVEEAGLFFGRFAWFPLGGGGTAGVLLWRVSSLDSRGGDKARDAARDESCETGSDSDSEDEYTRATLRFFESFASFLALSCFGLDGAGEGFFGASAFDFDDGANGDFPARDDGFFAAAFLFLGGGSGCGDTSRDSSLTLEGSGGERTLSSGSDKSSSSSSSSRAERFESGSVSSEESESFAASVADGTTSFGGLAVFAATSRTGASSEGREVKADEGEISTPADAVDEHG